MHNLFLIATSTVKFIQSLLSLLFLDALFLIYQKKGRIVVVWLYYGRFLSASIMTAPTTTIATIIPMTLGTKYKSAIDFGV
jgi:hypothetical protein